MKVLLSCVNSLVSFIGADKGMETLWVAGAGEIYDILPWNGAVMRPVADLMRELPPVFADGETVFPPVCELTE